MRIAEVPLTLVPELLLPLRDEPIPHPLGKEFIGSLDPHMELSRGTLPGGWDFQGPASQSHNLVGGAATAGSFTVHRP